MLKFVKKNINAQSQVKEISQILQVHNFNIETYI